MDFEEKIITVPIKKRMVGSTSIFIFKNSLQEKPTAFVLDTAEDFQTLATAVENDVCALAICLPKYKDDSEFIHKSVLFALPIGGSKELEEGYKITFEQEGKEIARAYVYFLGQYAYLEDVFVQEAYRGEGLGKQITQKAIDLVKEKDVRGFFLSCRDEKPKVQKLYESLGFKRDWVIQRKKF